MTDRAPALGIDLGTTNSAAAILRDGAVVVLENRIGELLTPSVVGLDRETDALLVGRAARELLSMAPDRAVATFKRGMGRDRRYDLGGREHGAVDLSALVLRALKEDASKALGAPVEECVITVPAYFDEEQRFATIKAGELAGLEVLRVLNEPTAAAMAYGMHERDRDAHFLVLDLGGGTFDVCVMERFAGILQVKSTAGESRLGGEDFTRRLVGLALEEVGLTYEGLEVADLAASGRLLRRAEMAKRQLTDADSIELEVPAVKGRLDRPVRLALSRAAVERAWEPLVRRLLAPCRQALRGARLEEDDLDEVILVGGATRMPVVRAFVRELFRREPVAGLDVDLAVVHGAAIQAALCRRDAAVEDVVVTDVLSHSLGVDVSKRLGGRMVHGYFSPVIHRNTVIPTTRVEAYSTMEPNQTSMHFGIYEGESRRVEENRQIGTLTVKGIPKGPPGQEACDVRFTYDLNGILEVEVTIRSTGRTYRQLFHRHSKALSDAEIARARERIEKLKEDPRDDPKVRELLLRAEALWSELHPEARPILEHALDALEEALEGRDERAIEAASDGLRELCDRMDGGERW